MVFSGKFILCLSVKQKHFGISSPLIRFSHWFRYTDLEIIWENDLTKVCKNIKHNSYLIKCHMIAPNPNPFLRPAKKPGNCDTMQPPFSPAHLEYFYAISQTVPQANKQARRS